MKLPRNLTEKAIFMAIVSLISVNILGSVISMMEIGFNFKNYILILHILPFIWLAVIASVLIAEKPAAFLKNQLVYKDDSFSSQIMVKVIFDVLIISFLMTIVGSWIGNDHISMYPIVNLPKIWPRNYLAT